MLCSVEILELISVHVFSTRQVVTGHWSRMEGVGRCNCTSGKLTLVGKRATKAIWVIGLECV